MRGRAGRFKGNVDMVDLNCGCPQNFALDRGYGAALLRDSRHLVDMCKTIAANIPYPLSVKCRLHENVETTIAILTQLHREAGVNTFTVHVRLRSLASARELCKVADSAYQGRYFWQRGPKRGQADWDAIRYLSASR